MQAVHLHDDNAFRAEADRLKRFVTGSIKYTRVTTERRQSVYVLSAPDYLCLCVYDLGTMPS